MTMTEAPAKTAERYILDAIVELRPHYEYEYAPMGALRETVANNGGPRRGEFDEVIRRMAAAHQIHVAPEENQKTITAADEYNAVTVGGEPKHLIAIRGFGY